MKKVILFMLIAAVFSTNVMAKLKVIYPNVNNQGENTFGYAALKLALENSGRDFEIQISDGEQNDALVRQMLEKKQISIADFGTSAEFEQKFSPVYFPIDLGLNGWRILLIHKENQSQFAEINSIEDLRTRETGQGAGWSDVEILESAGMKVVTAPTIENLIKMTDKKRINCFPLGANEAHSLLDIYKKESPNVVVEQELLLIYPFGRLFFVHKDNKELHDIVETGLIESFKNGSFWKMFRSHKSNESLFTKVNLKNRRQIVLDNPQMTGEFGAIPLEYFFNVNMLD